MTTHILPYQDGPDLVFCLVDDGQLVRYTVTRVFPGLGRMTLPGPLVTFPNLRLAHAFGRSRPTEQPRGQTFAVGIAR